MGGCSEDAGARQERFETLARLDPAFLISRLKAELPAPVLERAESEVWLGELCRLQAQNPGVERAESEVWLGELCRLQAQNPGV